MPAQKISASARVSKPLDCKSKVRPARRSYDPLPPWCEGFYCIVRADGAAA